MSSITVKIIKDGVEQLVTPKRVVDNIGVDFDKAKEYLVKSGVTEAELETNDAIANVFWSTYCNKSTYGSLPSTSYNTSSSSFPYPFGNDFVLSLALGIYNVNTDLDTLLPSGDVVSISTGVAEKSDTECSLSLTIDQVTAAFNKIKLFGNMITDILGDSVIFVHGLSDGYKTPSDYLTFAATYVLDGIHYVFSKGETAAINGVFAESPSSPGLYTRFTYPTFTFGGVVDDKPFLCYRYRYNSTKVEGLAINYDTSNDTFSSSDKSISLPTIFSNSNLVVIALYGYTSSWLMFLTRNTKEDMMKLYFTPAGSSTYVIKDLDFIPWDNLEYKSSFLVMLDGVLYLTLEIRRTKSADPEQERFYMLRPNTGDYSTATDFDIVDIKLVSSVGVFPCADGSWYFSARKSMAEPEVLKIEQDIPVFEIDLEEPVDATYGTCSLELNINISKGDNG